MPDSPIGPPSPASESALSVGDFGCGLLRHHAGIRVRQLRLRRPCKTETEQEKNTSLRELTPLIYRNLQAQNDFKISGDNRAKTEPYQGPDNHLFRLCYPLITSRPLLRLSILECACYRRITGRNSLFCLCFTGRSLAVRIVRPGGERSSCVFNLATISSPTRRPEKTSGCAGQPMLAVSHVHRLNPLN
jgi:hypothetical protein